MEFARRSWENTLGTGQIYKFLDNPRLRTTDLSGQYGSTIVDPEYKTASFS
jgi:hypothetical protein